MRATRPVRWVPPNPIFLSNTAPGDDNSRGRGTSRKREPLEIDDLAAREVRAEQERYDAVMRSLPRESPNWEREAKNHFDRLTGIYRDFIRRRLRERQEGAPAADSA